MPDAVNHPPHYNAHPSGIEAIEICEHLSFCLGNALKYIWRAGQKGDRFEDLRKAEWYLMREIEWRASRASWQPSLEKFLGVTRQKQRAWHETARRVMEATRPMSVLRAALLLLMRDDMAGLLSIVRSELKAAPQ